MQNPLISFTTIDATQAWSIHKRNLNPQPSMWQWINTQNIKTLYQKIKFQIRRQLSHLENPNCLKHCLQKKKKMFYNLKPPILHNSSVKHRASCPLANKLKRLGANPPKPKKKKLLQVYIHGRKMQNMYRRESIRSQPYKKFQKIEQRGLTLLKLSMQFM